MSAWDEEVRRAGPEASRFDEQEAEHLAVQTVRETRRDHKP